MNKRIRELAILAGFKTDKHGHLFGSDDIEKFAEAIVWECAQVANDNNHSKNRAVGVSVGDVIRTYFGIK